MVQIIRAITGGIFLNFVELVYFVYTFVSFISFEDIRIKDIRVFRFGFVGKDVYPVYPFMGESILSVPSD